MLCFAENCSKGYPNIQLSLNGYSFKELVEGLCDETIDLAFSLEFNFTDYSNMVYEVLKDSADNLAVHRTSPLFAKDSVDFPFYRSFFVGADYFAANF